MFETFKRPILKVVDDKIAGKIETVYSKKFKMRLRYK